MDFHFPIELEEFRQEFLKAEVDYLEKLVRIPEFIDYYYKFKNMPEDKLINKLETLYQMMENCQIKEQDESNVELQMICCCLAIEDYVKRESIYKYFLCPSLDNNT